MGLHDNKFTGLSEKKARNIRMLQRNEIFSRNRSSSNQNELSYLKVYDYQTQMNPIPDKLPPLCRSTISYYRRNCTPIFQTRENSNQNLDPHMTYESLWALAGVEDLINYENPLSVINQFQEQLPLYLAMPYPQIREMAISAAGNNVLGKQHDIIKISHNDINNIWVLINHIYERRIGFEVMFKYLAQQVSIVFQTVAEMADNPKDQIIDKIMANQQVLQTIINCCGSKSAEIQSFAIQIIGNILAEREDYATQLSHYNILQVIQPVLTSSNKQTRREGCWLISNYVFQSAPAHELLCKPKIIERILTMFRKQQNLGIRIELYYIMTHLVAFGKKQVIYKIAVKQNLLDQCSQDLELESTDLIQGILNLISKLIEIGEDFMTEDDQNNPFCYFIRTTALKQQIKHKTYSNNIMISNLSFEILDKVANSGMDSEM